MRWFLNKLFGWIARKPPRLICDAALWKQGVSELARRTKGQSQESGAYLLGIDAGARTKRILEFIFYDDIDPHALDTGEVTIRQTALPKLWEYCRQQGYGVVADVHVHPGGYHQSPSDQANPVMPRAGHIAMILPYFAAGTPVPGSIGIYEYCGGTAWHDHSVKGTDFVRLEGEL